MGAYLASNSRAPEISIGERDEGGNGMKVFVTGGAGQIGSTVCDALISRGDDVMAIDNFATGRRDNLIPDPRLTLVEDTIVDSALIDRLFAAFKPDVVLHTAASYKDPDDWKGDALVNTVGTAIVAELPARIPPFN